MSARSTDPWHFARPELAKQYLHVFDLGLTSARGLFAPRRMGKSEFLEKDLLPAAAAAGYRCAYLNLWDARSTPGPALAEALAQAMAPRGLAKAFRRLNTPLSRVKAGAKMPGLLDASLEAELGEAKAGASADFRRLLRDWADPGHRLLLVLDEAQVLADAAHADLAHALRSGLDARKATVKVIFAGSSEATLRRMFGRHSEPFYNWAPLEPFDLLGADFVDWMVDKTNALTRFELERSVAHAAFEQLHRTPEFFRRFLSRYLTHAQLGAAAALAHTQSQVMGAEIFRPLWDALAPLDRAVLLRVATAGSTGLLGGPARAELARAIGLDDALSASKVQTALRRLQGQDLLASFGHGEYRFLDDAFAAWVASLRSSHLSPESSPESSPSPAPRPGR